jgi:hypothetical protein
VWEQTRALENRRERNSTLRGSIRRHCERWSLLKRRFSSDLWPQFLDFLEGEPNRRCHLRVTGRCDGWNNIRDKRTTRGLCPQYHLRTFLFFAKKMSLPETRPRGLSTWRQRKTALGTTFTFTYSSTGRRLPYRYRDKWTRQPRLCPRYHLHVPVTFPSVFGWSRKQMNASLGYNTNCIINCTSFTLMNNNGP